MFGLMIPVDNVLSRATLMRRDDSVVNIVPPFFGWRSSLLTAPLRMARQGVC